MVEIPNPYTKPAQPKVKKRHECQHDCWKHGILDLTKQLRECVQGQLHYFDTHMIFHPITSQREHVTTYRLLVSASHLLVGETMMMTMITRPPNHASLSRTLSQESKYKRKGSRSFKRTMRKVSMITCCDPKHSNPIQNDTEYYSRECWRYPESSQ